MVNVEQHPPDGPRRRLLELAQERGASLSGLSQLIDRNTTYLQQFVRKGSPRKLEERDRRTLAEFFAVSESELGAPEEKSYPTPDPASEWIEIDRLPVGASAGPGAMVSAEAPFDAFRFSRRWLAEQGLGHAQLSAMTVEGDSMEPLLRDGDEILVDRSQRALRDGINVVRLDESVMVKRLASAGPGRVTLLSQNLAYPPVEVALEDIAIIGRVVWKGGRI